MTLGDIDEPPENFSTRRNAQKIHFAGFLLCVSLLFEVSGVVGGRVSQSRVLGYFLGPDDNDSSAALVQIEMKLMTAREMDSLDIAVNTHKCEPPFLAQTSVNASSLSTQNQQSPLNLNLVMDTSNFSSYHYNRTLKLCTRLNEDAWEREGLILFPPIDTDNTLDTNVTDPNQVNQVIDPGLYIPQRWLSNLPKEGLENGQEDEENLQESEPDWSLEERRLKLAELWEQEDEWRNAVEEEEEDEGFGWERAGRMRRQGEEEDEVTNGSLPKILGLKLSVTSSKVGYTQEDGRINVQEGEVINLVVLGFGLNSTSVRFTTSRQAYGETCGNKLERSTKTRPLPITSEQEGMATLVVPGDLLKYYKEENIYFICAQNPDTGEFIHQGEDSHLQIEVYTALLPVWLSIIMLVVLLCLSGLFSGLNLGLMSLDQTELRIVMSTGSEKEKSYAKAIMPIRGMGNFLLCSILLGNVLVNNSLTVLLDTLTGGGGIVAVLGATMGIVIFGEIIPQAICSRHGLAVGANTIWLTKFFMLLTSPLSFPISKVLDLILGAEIGTVYNRERLMELIKVTDAYTDLEKDEVNIVTGALVLKHKSVKDVMTKLDDVYMIPLDTVISFETISEIKDQGYSRIPVYDGERTNVKHILFAKDLLFIDPDDNKPVEEVCKFYKNDVNFVYQDTILTDMFDEFKSGEKGHMALVQEANTEGEGDPYYETIGLLTLEDIIEEIIQQEINDETDVILDNKTKKKRKKQRAVKDADFKMFLESKTKHRVIISPHLSLAILQFLTTSVKAFSPDVISARILQNLLNMDIYREIKLKTKENKKKECEPDDTEGVIMMKGKPCDFFILILEGRVQVTIGKEDHKFIEGPFTVFGEQMLEQVMNLPSSPMVSAPERGTTLSLSMHSSVNEVVPARTLKKTNTQVHLETGSAARRSGSTDAGLPSSGKQAYWIPDYTVKVITDSTYLKIRKATYLVALKASRMNNMNSESSGYNEKELNEALERVTEDDNDFTRTHSGRSPDKYWEIPPRSNAGTPTEFRRESLRSSLSMMKHKFMGSSKMRSNTSIDKAKDDFWDGMTNPALDQEEAETLSRALGSTSSVGIIMNVPDDKEDNNSLPLKPLNKRNNSEHNDSMSEANGTTQDGGKDSLGPVDGHTTVITVKGSDGSEAGQVSPSDRTSLLGANHIVS